MMKRMAITMAMAIIAATLLLAFSGCMMSSPRNKATQTPTLEHNGAMPTMIAQGDSVGFSISNASNIMFFGGQYQAPAQAPTTAQTLIGGVLGLAGKCVDPLLSYGMAEAFSEPTVVEQAAPVIVEPYVIETAN